MDNRKLAQGLRNLPASAREDLAGREQDIQRGKTVELLRRAGKEMYENPIVNTAVGLSPVLGDIQAGVEAYRSAQEGDWGNAGLNAMGMLPFIPMLGGMTKVGKLANEAPQAQALREAEEYGQKMLGLPPGNTPMDRAKAMGFENVYHGTGTDFEKFERGHTSPHTIGSAPSTMEWVSKEPHIAEGYALSHYFGGNPTVMPLMLRSDEKITKNMNFKKASDLPSGSTDKFAGKLFKKNPNVDVVELQNFNDAAVSGYSGTGTHIAVNDPSLLRSRFAAFDPRYKDKEGLLLGVGGLGVYGAMQGEDDYK